MWAVSPKYRPVGYHHCAESEFWVCLFVCLIDCFFLSSLVGLLVDCFCVCLCFFVYFCLVGGWVDGPVTYRQ